MKYVNNQFCTLDDVIILFVASVNFLVIFANSASSANSAKSASINIMGYNVIIIGKFEENMVKASGNLIFLNKALLVYYILSNFLYLLGILITNYELNTIIYHFQTILCKFMS